LATGEARTLHDVHIEGETLSLGCGSHALHIAPSTAAGDTQWQSMQLKLGWPWLPDEALNKCLAPMLSLQRLQAVAVDKGCYPGQEIVARLHFRGGCKRHLCSVTASRAIAPGETLRRDEQEVGIVLNVVSDNTIEALVVLSDDVVDNATDNNIALGNGEASLLMTTIERWPA
jgi:folate-binding protein YgfZ